MSLSPSQRLASVDDLLLYRMGRLSAAAGAMVVRLCEGGYGVTRREWAVIAKLHGHPGLLPSELAEQMHRDRARTSRTVTALLRKGLIERVTLLNDRRSARLSLTDLGQRLYADLMPQVQAINGQILSALTADEAAQFDGLLDRLQAQTLALQGQLHPVLPKANRHLGRAASTKP
jgi:DNA-binding MarR family transcriptional regulator